MTLFWIYGPRLFPLFTHYEGETWKSKWVQALEALCRVPVFFILSEIFYGYMGLPESIRFSVLPIVFLLLLLSPPQIVTNIYFILIVITFFTGLPAIVMTDALNTCHHGLCRIFLYLVLTMAIHFLKKIGPGSPRISESVSIIWGLMMMKYFSTYAQEDTPWVVWLVLTASTLTHFYMGVALTYPLIRQLWHYYKAQFNLTYSSIMESELSTLSLRFLQSVGLSMLEPFPCLFYCLFIWLSNLWFLYEDPKSCEQWTIERWNWFEFMVMGVHASADNFFNQFWIIVSLMFLYIIILTEISVINHFLPSSFAFLTALPLSHVIYQNVVQDPITINSAGELILLIRLGLALARALVLLGAICQDYPQFLSRIANGTWSSHWIGKRMVLYFFTFLLVSIWRITDVQAPPLEESAFCSWGRTDSFLKPMRILYIIENELDVFLVLLMIPSVILIIAQVIFSRQSLENRVEINMNLKVGLLPFICLIPVFYTSEMVKKLSLDSEHYFEILCRCFLIFIFSDMLWSQFRISLIRSFGLLISYIMIGQLDDATFEEIEAHDDVCAICREEMIHGVITNVIKKTPCDHLFHKNCIKSWIVNNRTCPFCMTELFPGLMIVANQFDAEEVYFDI